MSCFCCNPRRRRGAIKLDDDDTISLAHEYDTMDSADSTGRNSLLELRRSDSLVAQGSFPDIPIAFRELKQDLRGGLMPEARQFWWPLLPRVLPHSTLKTDPHIKSIATTLYLKTKQMVPRSSSLYGSPQVGTSYRTRSVSLNAHYSSRVEELLELISVQHDLPEPGLLLPLLDILVRIIPSIDLCLQMCFDITSRQEWFIALNGEEHRLNHFTFKELLKKDLFAEYTALEDAGALNSASLNLIFVDFFQLLLPFQSVVRVLDCYLLEGVAVLFNFGLALVYLNSDLALQATEAKITGCVHPFWTAVRGRFFNAELTIEDLMETAFVTKKSSFFSFVGGRGQSSSDIRKYRSLGKESLGKGLREPLNLGGARAASRQERARSLNQNSRILSSCPKKSQQFLLSILPSNRQDDHLCCVFSTSTDGWNMDSLYRRTLRLAPCVLLLRSLQQNVVLGAYLSVPLSPPSKEVRGDGMVFIFRLDGDNSAVYWWTGLNKEGEKELACTESSLTTEPSSTTDQFLVAAHDYIAVGGSSIHGANALRIDEDLAKCFAGPSDTFANPPLAPEEEVQPFDIDELEVLQLSGAKLSHLDVPAVHMS